MRLKEIYRPIEKELIEVEEVLKECLKNTKYKSILQICNYLLDARGKRLRPALVLLSAKASQGHSAMSRRSVVSIAAAMELIHMASLIHDDVIDHASVRYNKPTVNCRWDNDVSISLGDYLYSVAFELISTCGNIEVLQCISSATKAMSEGELLQVCERDNLDLLKERYIVIVKKKTASLFAASCHAGSLIADPGRSLGGSLKEYGLNFGIAFQIVDDYLDLTGEETKLGKTPGQDIRAGEVTLPILNLWESLPEKEKSELEILLASRKNGEALQKVRGRLVNSGAALKTKEVSSFFINSAKENIKILSYSPYKESLLKLADFIMERGFNDKN